MDLSVKTFRLSTDELPEQTRFEAFREVYGRTILKHDIELIAGSPFRFDGFLCSMPGLGLATALVSPCRAPRGPQHIDGDDLVLSIILSGGRVVHQRGREAVIRAGEAVLTSGADPGVVSITAASRQISLRVPRAALAPAIVDLDTSLLRPIPHNDPTLLLLIGYVEAVRDAGAAATPALQDLTVSHIHDLVSLTVGAEREARHLAEQRGMRAARQAAILRAIETRSSDQGLSAVAIAAELGVTPRYVHLLLEETGRSFTRHLLERRLERAAALLRDTRWRDRRIADVAAEAGFADLSHFSRAFRRRYGASPSDIRRLVFEQEQSGSKPEP
jgi:AraC-like DNA-binding protein